MTTKSVVFISTIDGVAWGGSEELWSRTALRLVGDGVPVGASVQSWSPTPARIAELAKAGAKIKPRTSSQPLWRRVLNKIFPSGKTPIVTQVEQLLAAMPPALVVLSDGGAFHPIDLLELCASKKLPFVTISHVNHEDVWPNDELARRYRTVLPHAQACFFVSNANRLLFEKQIGYELTNAEVVRNPCNVDATANPAWPILAATGPLRLACVGRLHPPSKGQHLLLEALADPAWRGREWCLTFYGEGPMRESIERLVQRFGLAERVRLAGHVDAVQKIWAENHVLVMPSRYEGLPLAIVEAMLCARPVVATDVAGHSEVIRDGVTGFLADAPTVCSMKKALERLWEHRTDLENMGVAAAASIRELMPPDPVGLFSTKIKKLARIK